MSVDRDDTLANVRQLLTEHLSTLVADDGRAEASDAATGGPIDSVVLVEALVSIEAELGIEVPLDAETCKSLGSVEELARRICDVATTSAGGT